MPDPTMPDPMPQPRRIVPARLLPLRRLALPIAATLLLTGASAVALADVEVPAPLLPISLVAAGS